VCWTLPGLPLVTDPARDFHDRISRRSRGEEGVWFGNLRATYLLFADDVVLLASSSNDLQLLWSGSQLSVKRPG